MKATEARKMALEANTVDIQKIYDDIKLFAEKGDYELHYYQTLTQEIQDQLREDGYVVTLVQTQPEYVINISWK